MSRGDRPWALWLPPRLRIHGGGSLLGPTSLASLLILPGLLLALVGGCAHDRGDRSAETAPLPKPTVNASLGPVPEFRDYMVGQLPEPPVSGRDPFHEDSAGPAPPARQRNHISRRRPEPALILRGIVTANGHRVALLQQGAVALGDQVQGWKVVAIDERTVLLEKNGRRRRLSL